MYQILTLNKISKFGLEKLDSAKYTCSDNCDAPDAILVRSASMHEMELSEKTIAIARAGAGVNNIPIDACSEKGVVVFNTPGANANAVKELVLCAMLLSSRKIPAAIDWCKTLKGEGEQVGKLVEKGKSAFAGPEILGKTIGVVGLGAIGALVAKGAIALGVNAVGYDPFISADAQADLEANGIKVVKDLDDIYAVSDYISLHLPLNDATRSLVSEASIAKMKDGVRILNFARGELVASADIVAAVTSGKVSAYITDFPTDEQIGVDGITAIPHLGASTPESEDNCAIMAAVQVADYLEKGIIKNSVNLPAAPVPSVFESRTCFIHKEDADFSAKAVAAAAASGAQVKNVFSAAKKGMGYTVVDTDKPFATDTLDVIKVRVL